MAEACKKPEGNKLPPMRTGAGHRLFPYPSLSEEDHQYMRVYQCHGEDHGLLNNYVLNYVYDFVVNHVLPSWLAPNCLTLAGPIPDVLVATLCILLPKEYTDPKIAGFSWVVLNISAALAVFWFLLMDNVDGKHARHIKWCSPLGDWLDHALDIVSYVSIITSLCVLSGIGTTSAYFFSGLTVLTYAIVIWEAQLCGELIIHSVEACSEGMFMIGCMHLVFAVFGDPTSIFQKVVFTLPETDYLAAIGMSGRDITVFIIFATVEILVAAASFLSVADVCIRLAKQEPVMRVLSALFGVLVPAFTSFISSALFFKYNTEACLKYPGANILQLVAPVIYSIYICNLCRLLGWRFSVIETFTRPMPLFFSLLPWILRLLPISAEQVLVISAYCSAGSLLLWFFSVTVALKKMLGIPLFSVGKREDKQN